MENGTKVKRLTMIGSIEFTRTQRNRQMMSGMD